MNVRPSQNVRVDHRCGNVTMPQQLLDRANIGVVLK